MDVPEEYGGGGVPDFRFNAVIGEEIMRAGAAAPGSASPCTTTSACPTSSSYCTDEQKDRVAARHRLRRADHGDRDDRARHRLRPGRRSPPRPRRDGDAYVVNGAKTFITNGINADLVITAVKTDPQAGAPRHVACS